MKKIIFKEKAFEYFLIGFTSLLLCWNISELIIGSIKAIVPISIQVTLLFLILTKNKNAKTGIKIWGIILIFGNGLSFLGKSIKIILGDEINLYEFFSKIIFLVIGILIYLLNKKYVELVNTDK